MVAPFNSLVAGGGSPGFFAPKTRQTGASAPGYQVGFPSSGIFFQTQRLNIACERPLNHPAFLARCFIAKGTISDQNPPMAEPVLKRPSVRIKAARWIFLAAAIYGFPVLGLWFFHTPAMVGRASWQQPEIYYGFAGVGLAWQAVFVLIASDPIRYRPLMLIAAFGEKFFFAGILVVLLLRHIARPHWIPPAVMDFSLGVAFLIAYFLTDPTKIETDQP